MVKKAKLKLYLYLKATLNNKTIGEWKIKIVVKSNKIIT
jgi:hypothetical protein